MAQIQGAALTPAPSTEVVTAYAAPPFLVPAVEESPGWHVIGAFSLPLSVNARVHVLGCVSDEDLTLRVRLYCITEGSVGIVSGSTVTITSTTPVEQHSGVVGLTGGRDYQYQAECTGGEQLKDFGVVSEASLAE